MGQAMTWPEMHSEVCREVQKGCGLSPMSKTGSARLEVKSFSVEFKHEAVRTAIFSPLFSDRADGATIRQERLKVNDERLEVFLRLGAFFSRHRDTIHA